MMPENEPLEGLEQREVMVLRAAVKYGVRTCREAFSVWLRSSEFGYLEDTLSEVASSMVRLSGTLGTPGQAENVLIRLLLIAIIEEMGRQHIVHPN